jgi:hypothetical protein
MVAAAVLVDMQVLVVLEVLTALLVVLVRLVLVQPEEDPVVQIALPVVLLFMMAVVAVAV